MLQHTFIAPVDVNGAYNIGEEGQYTCEQQVYAHLFQASVGKK